MRAWASENLKAHGILFLTLSQAVKDKITALCGTTGAERFFFFFFGTFCLGQSLQIQSSSDSFNNMLIRITLEIRSEWCLTIFDAIKK
jgi:hypothetical protein